jgi:hypothetical protein
LCARDSSREPFSASERFPLDARRQRWGEFVDLEHETLPPASDFSRDGDELLVRRERVCVRPLRERSVPREHRAALLLQGAAAAAFFAAQGFDLVPEDLESAGWDVGDGSARLWLTRTPSSVRLEGAYAGSPCSLALAALLRCLFGRGDRLSHPDARVLFDRLGAPDAPGRRPEFWVASALRAFPELARPEAAPARRRCLGVRGEALRSPRSRALAQ